MSAKHGIAAAVFIVLMAGPLVNAQAPADFPALMKQPDPAVHPLEQPIYAGAPPVTVPEPAVKQTPVQAACGTDSWIYDQAPYCCGPVGGHGPVGTELYFRSGPSFGIGGGDLADGLRVGWSVMGGGRSLFYSRDGYRAWLVDIALIYTYNSGDPNHLFPGLFPPNDAVTIRQLERTALSVGLGHDWWIKGPGDVGSFWDPNFRYGVDGGARYGSSHVDLNSIVAPGGYERVQKIYAGAYAGLHFDAEIPLGAWTAVAGVRGEWAYSDLHVLPGSNRINELTLMLNLGLRY
jgi:hypothetical protein